MKIACCACSATNWRKSAHATATVVIARGSKESGSAPTVNITVRIAGKHATFVWRNLMTDESTRVEFHLDRDPRLISAVRSAVQFQAARAGLEEASCENFAIAPRRFARKRSRNSPMPTGARGHARNVFRPDRNFHPPSRTVGAGGRPGDIRASCRGHGGSGRIEWDGVAFARGSGDVQFGRRRRAHNAGEISAAQTLSVLPRDLQFAEKSPFESSGVETPKENADFMSCLSFLRQDEKARPAKLSGRI